VTAHAGNGTDTCDVEFIADRGPTLTCDKRSRFHLVHRDPATGVRYAPFWRGIFCLCGIFRHRQSCPLKHLSKEARHG
jgi:hypothetical protein